MKELLASIIAAGPFGLALGAALDMTTWQAWAVLVTAFWWRVIGPIFDRATQEGRE